LEGWKKASVWREAGEAIQKKGDHETAIAFFTEAIKCKSFLEYYWLRCQSELEIGRYQAALEDVEIAARSVHAVRSVHSSNKHVLRSYLTY